MKPAKVISIKRAAEEELPMRDREVAARRQRLQRQIMLQELLLDGVALVLLIALIVLL